LLQEMLYNVILVFIQKIYYSAAYQENIEEDIVLNLKK
jgi:hypothetical protein